MIEADKRKAIYLLHKEGMGVREISRNMNISANTVNTIIGQAGEVPQTTRNDKIDIDTELVSRIYHQCDGRVQRTHEVLSEQHGINIGYSTLSRMIRELGFGKSGNQRCARVVMVNTLMLVAISIMPFFYGMGWIYLLAATGGGGYFIYRSLLLVLDTSPKNGMRAFFASLVQLNVLLVFAVLDALLIG